MWILKQNILYKPIYLNDLGLVLVLTSYSLSSMVPHQEAAGIVIFPFCLMGCCDNQTEVMGRKALLIRKDCTYIKKSFCCERHFD